MSSHDQNTRPNEPAPAPPSSSPPSSSADKPSSAPPPPPAAAAAAALPQAPGSGAFELPMIFSMGFDEALVQRALAAAAKMGGDNQRVVDVSQRAVDILLSGDLLLHASSSSVPPPTASLPAIFSMGFDQELVQRALANAGGDEQRAVDLIISGQVPSASGASTSASQASAPELCHDVPENPRNTESEMVGHSRYTYSNGDVYDGLFEKGKPHGKGLVKYADGGCYEGDWSDGKKHGRGVLTYASDGKACMPGVDYFWNAGDTYDGGWHDDKRHGACRYTFFNGETFDCTWEYDRCPEFTPRQCVVQARSAGVKAAAEASVAPSCPVVLSIGSGESLVPDSNAKADGSKEKALDSRELLSDGHSSGNASSLDMRRPAIFSLGFDAAVVQQALNTADGNHERAVDLIISEHFAPAAGCTSAASAVPAVTPILSPAPSINFSTEWLDEDGFVCPKIVDFSRQCPKGHALQALGKFVRDGPIRQLMCRICHASCSSKADRAETWFNCSVDEGCCCRYSVCKECAHASDDALSTSAVAASDTFRTLGIGISYLGWFRSILGPLLGRLSCSQFCQMFIRPRTSRSGGSVTDELLQQEDTRHHVGEATWFISHTFSNAFLDTLDSVLLFFSGRDDAATAKVWLDVFVMPQIQSSGQSKPSSFWMTTFKNSIARMGRLLLVVDVWNNPTALRRAWCVLELHAILSKKADGAGEFAVAMTADEKNRFLRGISAGIDDYYDMLGTINAERSDCSRAADRESIHSSIRHSIGFDKLGRQLFCALEQWMEEQLRSQAAANVAAGDVVNSMKWNGVLASVFAKQGKHEDALVLQKMVIDTLQRELPHDHPDLGISMIHLANTYNTLGRLQDAVEIEERVQHFQQRFLSHDDPNIGHSMSQLAATYFKLGKVRDAHIMYERVLEFQQRVLPKGHPHIGSAMLDVAAMCLRLGMHQDALVIQKAVLGLRQRQLSDNHPDTCLAMEQLAYTYGILRRHQDALILQENVLTIRVRVLPENHPRLGDAMSNLAETYRALGRLEEALVLQEKVLKFRRHVLPSNHPLIGGAMHGIACTCDSLGRHQLALVWHHNTLQFFRCVLPENHPNIGRTMGNIAVTYYALGMKQDSLVYLEHALQSLQLALPHDHPDTVAAMVSLAGSYFTFRRHADEVVLREKVLEIRQRKLPEDPDTVRSMVSLAASYHELKRHSDAVVLREKILEIQQRVLPEGHPDMGSTMNNLANSYYFLDRLQDALIMRERTVELRQRYLSENHPLLGDALFNLSISYKQNGDWHMAILCARQALRVRQTTLPLSHPNVAAVDRWIQVLKENVEADSSDEDDGDDDTDAPERCEDDKLSGECLTPWRGHSSGVELSILQCSVRVRFLFSFTTLRGPAFHRSQSQGYYEITVSRSGSRPQFGFCTSDFTKNHNDIRIGCGDDQHSWGWDGVRQLFLNDGAQTQTEMAWADGDRLEFEVDFTCNKTYFSKNGQRVEEHAFSPSILTLHPCISARDCNIVVSFDREESASSAQEEPRDVSEDTRVHAATVECMQTAGSVVLARHRGGGCAFPDYALQFHDFNTFVAEVELCGGCFYWEVTVLDIAGVVQFGCCTDGFQSRDDPRGEGAGDDEWSWAVCGRRQQSWHAANGAAFGSEWSAGDVIGFALDMRTVGAAVMSVSVNGSFAAPNGVVFSDIGAPYLSPALTGYGLYHVNFGDRPFEHAPPCSEFESVHYFVQDGDDDDLRLAKLLSVSLRDCGAPAP